MTMSSVPADLIGAVTTTRFTPWSRYGCSTSGFRNLPEASITTSQPDQSVAAHPLLWVTRMRWPRSEEHTSELQSLMRISYAVFFWQINFAHPPVQPIHTHT